MQMHLAHGVIYLSSGYERYGYSHKLNNDSKIGTVLLDNSSPNVTGHGYLFTLNVYDIWHMLLNHKLEPYALTPLTIREDN